MSRKVFISFLGTGNYVQTCYQFENENIVSKPVRFIQEALIEYHCRHWNEEDCILIFHTGKDEKDKSKHVGSYWKNWLDQSDENPQGNDQLGLQRTLQDMHLPVQIEDYTIPEGFSEEEIWNIFDVVCSKLKEGDAIYFDVTHAFRSIPMFSTILFNYTQYIKNTHVESIYYGAFEKLGPTFEVKKLPLDKRIAPIINLSSFIRLQSVTTAVSSFHEYGRLNNIGYQLSDSKLPALKALQNAIKELDDNIRTNRASEIQKGLSLLVIQNSIRKLRSSQLPLPVKNIIEQMKEELERYGFVAQNDIRNIKAAIDWAYHYKMISQAYILVREYFLTIITEKIPTSYNPFGTSNTDKDFREFISAILSMPDKDVASNTFKGTLLRNRSLTIQLLELNFVKQIRPYFTKIAEYRNGFAHGKPGKPLNKIEKEFHDIYNNCLNILENISQDDIALDTSNNFPSLLVNFSNHPYSTWTAEQQEAANTQWGEVIDIPFPEVEPTASQDDIANMADKYAKEILEYGCNKQLTVHVMGEMTLTFAVVKRLQAAGVTCIASTTERLVDSLPDNGKHVQFKFSQFRTYETI